MEMEEALNNRRIEKTQNKAVCIHPTAVVEKGAELGVGVEIGPFAYIGPKVTLEDGVKVRPHAVVEGRTHIGSGSEIWQFASIGSTPQDLKYKGEDTRLICGKNNSFRESVTVSIGTEGGGGVTQIGSNNLFMAYTHIAHDCVIEDSCIFANGATLAGHIEVASRAVVGGLVAIHQFVRIGTLAMLGGGSMVAQDVPPFVMVSGNRAKPIGLNKLGIDRANFSASAAANIKKSYKALYQLSSSLEEAKKFIRDLGEDSKEVKLFLDFLEGASTRGICR